MTSHNYQHSHSSQDWQSSQKIRPVLTVLLGAPGSGKSAWCRAHPADLGTVLSLDAARARLGTGEADQDATPAAVADVRARAATILAAGGDVVLDATGATAADRATWLTLAAEHDAEAVALPFATPLATCLRHNALRQRVVPATVLTLMWLSLRDTTPTELHREGFHRVTTVCPEPIESAGEDERDWRHVAELAPGATIWNPEPDRYPHRGADEAALDVVAVAEPDADGMVTVTTTHPQPLVLAADWTVTLYTTDDTALITYLMATEPTDEERHR